MYTATTVQENHFQTIPITREPNHHITQVIEEDHQNEEIHKIRQKIITIDQIVEITTPDQIQIQHNLFLRSNSQSRNKYYPNNQSRNSSYNRNRKLLQ